MSNVDLGDDEHREFYEAQQAKRKPVIQSFHMVVEVDGETFHEDIEAAIRDTLRIGLITVRELYPGVRREDT